MKFITEFRRSELAKGLISQIQRKSRTQARLMEFCGGHTVTIFRYGIRQVLPPTIEMVSGPGTFVPDTGLSPITDSICFDPESKDSTYEFIFKVTDSCDSTRQDTFYATVNVNQPPVVTLPADIDTFLCDPQEICFDSLIASDPDSGDTFIVDLIEGSGTFDPDTGVSPDSIVRNHCFTPTAKDSTYRFIFEITDPCGETDRDTFNMSVDIGEPPQIFAPETLY